MKKNRLTYILILVIILVCIFYYELLERDDSIVEIEVSIGDLTILSKVADSPRERKLGLSNTEVLEENQGLLFVFKIKGKYSFWMKDVEYPLDIIWIDEEKTVVGIEKNVQPDSYPKRFESSIPVKYFLEINAGESEVISIGDKAVFDLNGQE